jgi:hypothetical protein
MTSHIRSALWTLPALPSAKWFLTFKNQSFEKLLSFIVSLSLARENLRGLRELSLQENPALLLSLSKNKLLLVK